MRRSSGGNESRGDFFLFFRRYVCRMYISEGGGGDGGFVGVEAVVLVIVWGAKAAVRVRGGLVLA